MKTNEKTQRKEQQEQQEQLIQQDHIDSNRHLENDEKILYSESVENSGDTLVGTATTLFLIFGFPFYIIIGFTALTAYLSEKSINEFGQEVMWPAMILLAVAGISIVLGIAFRSFHKSTLGREDTKFLITNKRIYKYNPDSWMPLMFESRYPDVLYIYPDKLGQQEYLQVRVKALETLEGNNQIVEKRFAFPVKNAKKAFMHIPDDVRWERGEKSKNGAIYKIKTKRETVFAMIGLSAMVCFLAFVVITMDIQITVEKLMGDGKTLCQRGQFVQAERVYREAYRTISLFSIHSDFGPAAFRYAQVLETNGKLDAAIPVYLEAIRHCNWTNSENLTWKPAVFRSNVHLAEIYLQKKNDIEAEHYFDQALETASLETDEKQVRELFSNYQNFLNARSKVGKAAQVNQLASIFKVSTLGVKTFSDWSDKESEDL